jgi:hypothetical protein
VSYSLKVGVDLKEEWKTSFSSEMTLSTLESGPMILPSTVYPKPLRSEYF